MPTISTGSKVLVTGATGFLGAWILDTLLNEGFHVRVAIRSPSKADFIKARYPTRLDKLDFVIVQDITSPGAFDEAVKDVSGIIHSASPLVDSSDPQSDPEEHIKPAVQGTLGILKSAEGSPSVQRIVITSSVSAVWETVPKSLPVVYNESQWNEDAPVIIEEKGCDAPPFVKYAASKTLAEQAAWKLIKDDEPHFDFVAILPGYIWGPIISETTADIKGSNRIILKPLNQGAAALLTKAALTTDYQGVDVRDCARNHVRALVVPEAGNQRFLSVSDTISVEHIYDTLNKSAPEGIVSPKVDTSDLKEWRAQISFSNDKSKDTLGASYRPIEATIRDTVSDALSHGWKQ